MPKVFWYVIGLGGEAPHQAPLKLKSPQKKKHKSMIAGIGDLCRKKEKTQIPDRTDRGLVHDIGIYWGLYNNVGVGTLLTMDLQHYAIIQYKCSL